MITVIEKYNGRRPEDGDGAKDSRVFLAMSSDGSDTENDAVAAVRASALAPLTLTGADGGGLTRKSVALVGTLFNGWYEVEARYVTSNAEKQTGESEYAFDTTGGQFKITQSKSTIGRYKVGGSSTSAPDLKGVIGSKPDGDPDGVDIVVPQFAFSETHYIADSSVTDTYKGYLYSLTGRTNAAAFKGLAIGEALYMGARGSKRGRGDWQITFNFAGSPNVTGLTVGDLTGIAKKGWEYLWVRYQMKVVGTGADAILAPVPQFVYVEKVYDAGDFSLLGIGT